MTHCFVDNFRALLKNFNLLFLNQTSMSALTRTTGAMRELLVLTPVAATTAFVPRALMPAVTMEPACQTVMTTENR